MHLEKGRVVLFFSGLLGGAATLRNVVLKKLP